MKEPGFKIGDLARKTGLTVRTLRYYHEIGLLKPASRSESGYRMYGYNELEQLQKIRSLKFLGLELEEIKTLLAEEDPDLESILYRQMKRIRTEIELGRELYTRLEKLAGLLKAKEKPSSEDLIQNLNTMNMYEKYYSKDQLDYLENRRKVIGEERIQKVQQEWTELIAEVRSEMEKDSDPTAKRMQELATKWKSLIREFTGGNEGIRHSLENMYQQENPQEVSQGFVDEDVMKFIGKAMKK